eukprot:Gregarina_sp_Poly_1__3987@NODE_21_length_20913_cov_102_783268_g19_i0_p6_GENE_NODE_21_length_20913_cov_102_783268_g19_i0NODE_21_length_20913_cov_102_783268_g19_i0_p6_ORF_typecomplete_len421_score96_91Apolipoprotein/PF01442_18/0_00019Apolipoprotein/PF01442_18/8_7e03Selenoprotein_S/PF06936_11/1_8e04Selenoprotein_S/PF06936_11/4_6e03Selenoprotein_S/PF06936_11/0_0086DUF2240/PF09999_9/0_036ApoLpIII/PF07464_11/2_6e03ApoLpIII/PF07464_11/1_2ApoLpIII/PF07464_11/19Baculo_PEP_C/PF04513_12/0_2Baculo_PEP_C/PF0
MKLATFSAVLGLVAGQQPRVDPWSAPALSRLLWMSPPLRPSAAEEVVARILSGGDGRAQQMKAVGPDTPRRREDLKRQKKMKKLGGRRGLGDGGEEQKKQNGEENEQRQDQKRIEPPLAPSFERLQAMVDDVSRKRPEGQKKSPRDSSLVPCLLRPEGCRAEESEPPKLKDHTNGAELKKTQASIEQAVTKLQQDLDRRTAEVVKEIERRAGEMRRRIAIEAEQLIAAVKYLVTLLADSVARADEMGEGFVREWYDEAENRYVGGASKQLDEEISSLDDDLKNNNPRPHSDMVDNLKESVKKTRDEFGAPSHPIPPDSTEEESSVPTEDSNSEPSQTSDGQTREEEDTEILIDTTPDNGADGVSEDATTQSEFTPEDSTASTSIDTDDSLSTESSSDSESNEDETGKALLEESYYGLFDI